MPRIPPVTLPGVPVRLRTADGVDLAGWHVPPPRGAAPSLAILVAHGFTGSFTRPPVQQVVRVLAGYAGVLALDLRGHGSSGGHSTLGDREVLDVDVAVRALRGAGYDYVATTGWSMGGSAVLRQAGLADTVVHGHMLGPRPDLVVAVSATSRWGVRDTAAMRRVERMVMTRIGRQISSRMGARVDHSSFAGDTLPAAPVEVAAGIAPTPLLVVHGDSDHYFTLEHPRALVAAAGPTAELWEVPGFGHAEAAAALDPDLLDRLGQHLVEATAKLAQK